MKKFKLFALTALFCAMGTNAFAQEPLADGYLRYQTNAAETEATITGFVATNKVAAVTIPAQVTDPRTEKNGKKYNVTAIAPEAFINETIIESVTIADTNVGTIGYGAFAGCTNLASVTIGKKVTAINSEKTAATVTYSAATAGPLTAGNTYFISNTGYGEFIADGTEVADGTNYFTVTGGTAAVIEGAFQGCTKLTTVTFNAHASTDVLTMDVATFAKTGITKLDLTGSNVTTVNQWFEELNAKLTEIVLPVTLLTIEQNAFKKLATLTTIDWTACTSKNITIKANAFSGAPLIKKLTLPAKLNVLDVHSLKGSVIEELTITSPAAGGSLTVNATGAGEKLVTLNLAKNAAGNFIGTFNANAFASATKLATININGDLQTASQLAASSFVGAGSANTADAAGIKMTVNYTPASTAAKAVKGIDVAAFAAAKASAAADIVVKLVTSNEYGSWITSNYTATTLGDVIYIVKLSFAEATSALAVATGGSSKFYYAKLYSSNDYKIAKKQGDATVIVYQGYVDQSDATIYMENLHIIDGYYWVDGGEAVIVKSTAADDVILTESDGSESSIVCDGTGFSLNEIAVNATDDTGLAIKDAYATLDQTPYFLAPIADNGYLWAKFKDERVIVGGTSEYDPDTKATAADFLIGCDNPAAARLNVVWLDGSEDNTTAIETVKQAVNEGVIYNLAGQKVDANFKGVVIKNGKKMIQK